MANRPIFTPQGPPNGGIRTIDVEFHWHGGFAITQKQKNIAAMHAAAKKQGVARVLEVSSKSADQLGASLSAFSLQVSMQNTQIPLECAFQGSKVFEQGGPYAELYQGKSVDAKRDERLRNSGDLKKFSWEGEEWPLEPKTLFYDWIYMRALQGLAQSKIEELMGYDGFTDVEFNPEKSINCQAKSCALFVSWSKCGILPEVLKSRDAFIAAHRKAFGIACGQPSLF